MKSGAGGGSLAVVWGFLLVFAALCLWPTNGESEYGAFRPGGVGEGPPRLAREPRRGSRCGPEGLPVRGVRTSAASACLGVSVRGPCMAGCA